MKSGGLRQLQKWKWTQHRNHESERLARYRVRVGAQIVTFAKLDEVAHQDERAAADNAHHHQRDGSEADDQAYPN